MINDLMLCLMNIKSGSTNLDVNVCMLSEDK